MYTDQVRKELVPTQLLDAGNRRAWRAWLRAHAAAKEIWLVFWKKHTGHPYPRGVACCRVFLLLLLCASAVFMGGCGGVSSSLRLLATGSESERLQALAEIAGSRAATPEVIGALSRGLEDPSAAVRWESAGALSRLGPNAAGALPALLGCAERQQEALALRCAQAAAAMGPGALPGLRRHLASADAATRRRGARALAGLGTAAAPAVDELISLFGDADPGVSAAAIDSLVAVGHQALLPLLKIAGRPGPMLRGKTSSQTAANTAIDAMKPYPASVLLDVLARGGDAANWAAEKIRQQGMEAEAIPVLIRYLKSGHGTNVGFASQELRSYGSKAAPAILDLVASLGEVPTYAESALAGLGDAAMPLVEPLLRAPDEQSRDKGIRILAQLRPLPHKRLLELAHGEDERLRNGALEILERATALDLAALLDLSRDPVEAIRRTAVLGLGHIPPWNEKAGDALLRLLLQDERKLIRIEAARALGRMRGGAAPAAPALAQALADPEADVNRYAGEALFEIGEEALPALFEAFRTGNAAARTSALAVFTKLHKEGQVSDAVERGLRVELARNDTAARTYVALALLVAGRSRREEIVVAADSLRSGDPALVRTALGALRAAGVAASEALPVLLGMAPDVGRDLAGEYLETLTRVGRRDPRLIPIYIDALRRGAGSQQARAGLAWFDDDAIVPLLALLKEKDVKGKADLEEALIERGAAAVPALEAALASADDTQRRSAARLLCRREIVPPQAVPTFIGVLQQDDRSAWPEALRCLTKAGAALAPHADLLAKLYERMDHEGRLGVIDALGFCGEAAKPHLPLLLAAVPGPAPGDTEETRPQQRGREAMAQQELQDHAIPALGRLGGIAAAAVPVLMRWAVEPMRNSDVTQRLAVDALGRIGPEARAAIPMLVSLLDSPNEVAQEETLNALIALAAPAEILVPKCLSFLGGKQIRLEGVALRYLESSGYDSADFRVLLEKLASSRALGLEATRALRRLRPPTGGRVLIAPDFPGFELTSWGAHIGWWQPVPGATGYRLFRRQKPDGEWAQLEESGAAQFDDHGVEPGRVYDYRVEAFNADADGWPSEVQTIEITGTQIREQHAPPAGLTVETSFHQRGDRDVRVARLRWEAPRGWDCRGYVIFRGLTGASQFAPIGVSRTTSFVDDRTSPAYSESYYVRGIDPDFRQSEASNEAVAAAARPAR